MKIRRLFADGNLPDDGSTVAQDDVGNDGLAGLQVVAYPTALQVVVVDAGYVVGEGSRLLTWQQEILCRHLVDAGGNGC